MLGAHGSRTPRSGLLIPLGPGAGGRAGAVVYWCCRSMGLTVSSVPAVFLAGSYPYTKRFLAIPRAYLGIAFGFGIPMAFAAFRTTSRWWPG